MQTQPAHTLVFTQHSSLHTVTTIEQLRIVTFPLSNIFSRLVLNMGSSKRLFEGLTFFLQYSDRPKDTFFSDMRLIRVCLSILRVQLLTIGRRMMVGQLAFLSTRSLHMSWSTSRASLGFTPTLYLPTHLLQVNRL